MGKAFFYRLDAAEFMAAVFQIPEGKHKEWLSQLAVDLVNGVGTSEFSQKLIQEVADYRQKQSEAGKRGANKRYSNPKTTPKRPHSNPKGLPSDPIANSSNNKPIKPIYPDWLPLDLWEAFKEMRVKIKKPMTAKAEELRLKDLENLMGQGYDTQKILERTIKKCWQDFYPQQEDLLHQPGSVEETEPERRARLQKEAELYY